MTDILRQDQLYAYATQAGFTGNARDNIVAIAMAESGGNPTAQNCNNPGGSCDRGILQINNQFHPEVSDKCAYNPLCAFTAAFSISNGGTDFSPWTTFKSGAYTKFLNPGGPTYPTLSSTGGISSSLISGLTSHTFVFILAMVAVILGLIIMYRRQ